MCGTCRGYALRLCESCRNYPGPIANSTIKSTTTPFAITARSDDHRTRVNVLQFNRFQWLKLEGAQAEFLSVVV